MKAPYGSVKGAAIRELVLWYESRHDARLLRAVVRSLPPELGAELDADADGLGILASRWYDARVVHLLLDAVTAKHPIDTHEKLLREGVRYAVDRSTVGVYRFVIEQIVSPQLYARNIERLWHLMHDTGHRSIELVQPTRAISRTWGWSAHHPLLCLVAAHTMGAIFETMRCRNVVLERRACVSEGDEACVYELSFLRDAR